MVQEEEKLYVEYIVLCMNMCDSTEKFYFFVQKMDKNLFRNRPLGSGFLYSLDCSEHQMSRESTLLQHVLYTKSGSIKVNQTCYKRRILIDNAWNIL